MTSIRSFNGHTNERRTGRERMTYIIYTSFPDYTSPRKVVFNGPNEFYTHKVVNN